MGASCLFFFTANTTLTGKTRDRPGFAKIPTENLRPPRAKNPWLCAESCKLVSPGRIELAAPAAMLRNFGLPSCAQGVLTLYPDVVKKHLGIGSNRVILNGISVGHENNDAPVNASLTTRVSLTDAVTFFSQPKSPPSKFRHPDSRFEPTSKVA